MIYYDSFCQFCMSYKPDKLHPGVIFQRANSNSSTPESASHMRQKVVLGNGLMRRRNGIPPTSNNIKNSSRANRRNWDNLSRKGEFRKRPSGPAPDWASMSPPLENSLCLWPGPFSNIESFLSVSKTPIQCNFFKNTSAASIIQDVQLLHWPSDLNES